VVRRWRLLGSGGDDRRWLQEVGPACCGRAGGHK